MINQNLNPNQISASKVIIENSFSDWVFENTFITFESFNGFFLLVYATEQKSIIFYNLIHFQLIAELKNAHKEYITHFSHCYDTNLKMDLIMSVSRSYNNIKIWNLTNYNCVLNLENVNTNGILNSACFLNYNKDNYIVTSNRNWENPEWIKVYNLKGDKITQIKNSKWNTFFVDVYYDNINELIYIIAGNEGNVVSYNYNENDIYNVYCEIYENDVFHQSFKIFEERNRNKTVIKLIESSDGNYGVIRIWDFHEALLLGKIESSNNIFRCICIWDNNYIFSGCGDRTIKLINLENNKIVNNLIGHKKGISSFKIIVHPKLGKCIISQGSNSEQIRIWTFKN